MKKADRNVSLTSIILEPDRMVCLRLGKKIHWQEKGPFFEAIDIYILCNWMKVFLNKSHLY